MTKRKRKRATEPIRRDSWDSGDYFEAGYVIGSVHPRNNIYLRFSVASGIRWEFDFTVDEAASIISVLAATIAHWTSDKREALAPVTASPTHSDRCHEWRHQGDPSHGCLRDRECELSGCVWQIDGSPCGAPTRCKGAGLCERHSEALKMLRNSTAHL
jgi:hypothetical protein